jgi:hypothetical protein
MKNVTVTGNINISGYSASIPIVASTFVGQISDPTVIAGCQSDLAYNVVGTSGSKVSISTVTSYPKIQFASDLTQYRKAVSTDYNFSSVNFTSFSSQIVVYYD